MGGNGDDSMKTELIMTVKEMEDRKAWEDVRFSGIGGSDAAAALGMSPWKSQFKLWLEKTQQVPPEDLSDNEYVYWGTVLEAVVANRFCELTGKKVHRRGMLRSCEYPFMLANVDRLVDGEDAGLECKTANGFAAKEWIDDKLPVQYYIQCQHYMAVTGLSKWYIAVLIGGNHFVWKEVARCEDDITALIAAEKQFWEEFVIPKRMPPVDGSTDCGKALAEKYTGGVETPVELGADGQKAAVKLAELEEQKKQIERAIAEEQNKLKLLLGDYEVGFTPGFKVTWKTAKPRITVDSSRLRKERPDIFTQYQKHGKASRTFRLWPISQDK